MLDAVAVQLVRRYALTERTTPRHLQPHLASMQTWDSVLRRVRELAVLAAKVGPDDVGSREAIATEIEGLRDTVQGLANGDGATSVFALLGNIVADLRRGDEVTFGVDDVESLDLAEAITELKLQEVAYRGALGATNRVLQPTLKDFLR